MKFSDALEHFGTQANMARALDTTDKVVWAWKNNKRIPLSRQWQIQLVTGGKLRADPAHTVSQVESAA